MHSEAGRGYESSLLYTAIYACVPASAIDTVVELSSAQLRASKVRIRRWGPEVS